jgi:hypothetical protein
LTLEVSFETSTGGERGFAAFIIIPVNMGLLALYLRTG